MSEVQYVEDVLGAFTLHRRPVPKRGPMQLAPGQNADGYGRKITSDIVLKLNGENRERRVYTMIFSNAGSNYIVYNGKNLFLRTYFQDDVLD